MFTNIRVMEMRILIIIFVGLRGKKVIYIFCIPTREVGRFLSPVWVTNIINLHNILIILILKLGRGGKHHSKLIP